MALDREELNKRRQAREEERKKRKRAQRLMRLRLAAAVLVLIACGVGLAIVARDTGSPIQSVLATQPEEQATEAATEAPTEAPTEALNNREQAPVKINLVAGGDLNITDHVVWSGQQGGDFDYTKAFMDVAPILSEADLSS